MLRRIAILFLFGIASNVYADLRSASPFVIFYVTSTVQAPWTFASSMTVTGGTLAVNGQAYVWPSTAPTQGQHLSVRSVSGGYNQLIWGGDGGGGGSASVSQYYPDYNVTTTINSNSKATSPYKSQRLHVQKNMYILNLWTAGQ